MSEIGNTCVAGLNSIGHSFCHYAAGMFLQTGILVAVLAITDFFLRKRIRATLRCWIWMLVFVKLLLPPSLCVPTGIGYWLGQYVSLSSVVSPLTMETATPQESPEMLGHRETGPRVGTPAMHPSGPVPGATAPVASAPVRLERLGWQAVIFLLWSAGAAVFTALVVQRLLLVRRLIARGQAASDDLVEMLEQCGRRVGVRRRVALRLSPNTFSPAVCGLLRPTILIPAALLESLAPDKLQAVLIHELAHVKRADLWVNSLQTVLQIVYFYNPLVWLANAIVRRVREQAVDEMVLVALGAEARSYSRMLIDMAEMAFLRVSPALRLIGVAESRKSLEGRIRHMIARPIPKSARMGVVGVLVVAATGAVLLPMAAAGTKTAPPRFTADLPNGVTVELVGVCNWPAGDPVCCKADGSPLDEPLRVTKWNQRPGAHHYGFMLHIAGPNDLDRSWSRIEGSDGWEAGCDVVDAQGNRLDGHTAAVALLKEGTMQTSLRLGFATGPWSTVSSHDGKRMNTSRHTGVLWSQMFEDSAGTSVVATAEWRKDRTERIVAIDREGVMHAPPSGSVAQGNMDQMTTRFPGLKPTQIKEFQYQVRPYEWVEFRNVSLRPGHRTFVTVHVGAPEERTPRVGGALSGSDDTPDRKAYSRTCLANLGKAVLLYANDHDDQLPAGIENMREYLNGEEAEWLSENVVYLGKDLSPADYPGLAVAYDRTMLAEGKGTNVLYLDAHVDFENSQELERLGISSVRWDAALRTHEVNRRVADFPRAEDFSTPEAAYATINRIDRDDPSAWQRVSVAALAEQFARQNGPRKTTGDAEWARVLNYARIIEVMVWDNRRAAVMAQLPQGLSSQKIVAPIDVRYLERENGRWLNSGNDRFWTVQEAKAKFLAQLAGAERQVAEEQHTDRATVMGHLKQLALAAIMYAEDHQGSLASNLGELKPYFGEEGHSPWATAHAVYLGAGARLSEVASPASTPLAYWKSPTMTGGGTVVAFLDGHVEWVQAARLPKFGITAGQRQGAAVAPTD